MLKSVNRTGNSQAPAREERPATALADAAAAYAVEQPFAPRVRKSLEKRQEVLILSNFTDVPLEELRSEETLECIP